MLTKRLSFSAACAAASFLLASPVWAQPSFSLSVSPATVYVNESGLAACTITVTPAGGFNGSVVFSLARLPKGVAASFRPGSPAGTTELVFAAGKVAQTGKASVTLIGTSGSLTETTTFSLAVSAGIGTGGAGLPVDLSAAYNVYGIYTNGTPFNTGGLDTVGFAYSANLLAPWRVLSGVQFYFGPANQPDAISGTDQPIPLPAGRYTNLVMLGNGVEGNQAGQVITVTYTDGSIQQFVQSFSDWYTPQYFTGELEAVEMRYRNVSNGTEDSRGTFYLYGYNFVLDGSKFVHSVTLPNNRYLVVLAMTLL